MSFVPDPGQGGGFAKGIGEMIGTGGVSAKAVEQAKAEVGKLVDAAKSGGFKLSEEGLEPLRTAIQTMRHDLVTLTQSALFSMQAPKLGSHPYGHAVAQHDQKGASEATNSAKAVLDQFLIVLDQAEEALFRAAGVYKENEHGATGLLNAIQS